MERHNSLGDIAVATDNVLNMLTMMVQDHLHPLDAGQSKFICVGALLSKCFNK